MFDLIKFIEEAHKQSYSKGSYSNSTHEANIRLLLIQCGAQEVLPGKIKGYSKRTALLKPNQFVCQPDGNNSNPDFAVRLDNGMIQDIEAKSSDGHEPMYNSVPPKENCLYVLASKKFNMSAVYLANDVMTNQRRDAWYDHVAEHDALSAKFNVNQSLDFSYPRVMYYDKVTKHFETTVRDRLYQGAMDFAAQKITSVTSTPATTIPLGQNITLKAPTLQPLFEGL